jgi:hypothetical protein
MRVFHAASVAIEARHHTIEFISIKSSAAKGEDEPGIMQGTTEIPHPIADAHLL